MASNPARVVAWTASITLHVLACLVVFAWFATREEVQRSDPRSVDTRIDQKDAPILFEIDLTERLASKAKPTLKLTRPAVETRISAAVEKMPGPGPGSGPSPAQTAKSDGQTSKLKSAAIPLHSAINHPGKSLVYVLDCSGSMGIGDRWAKACDTLLASIENLSEGMYYQIVLYDRTARLIDRGSQLRPVKKTELSVLREILGKKIPEGESRHSEGLRKALLLQPDVVFLLTDADDFTQKEFAEVSPLFRNQKFNVFLFGESNIQVDSPLHRLTKERRGGMYIVGKEGLEKVQ
ncbi:VWA domain-containing protein [Telmatocola sphagniphila]|uniref:VWA domain-containing protein n=1 Tax=Telmatocola sphagniphila TaxID=1123043 RepID=A0A8E6B254_9BACT|nr:vWA domain-containing protein [Telmatocola sphagniphila]QVL29867.1 VWA domain-containing protein [Telmatocola sphagniphila]